MKQSAKSKILAQSLADVGLDDASFLLNGRPGGISIWCRTSALCLLAGVLSVEAAKPEPAPLSNPEIAYIAEADQLKVMDADGSNQRLIYVSKNSGMGNGFSTPAWHPDGQKIFFTANGDLLRINLDGTELMTVVRSGGRTWQSANIGEVSPFPGLSGKHRLAYTLLDAGSQGVFLVDEDGLGQRVQIAPPRAGVPTWSPEGEHLFYLIDGKVRVVSIAENLSGVWVTGDRLVFDPTPMTGVSWVSCSKAERKLYLSMSSEAPPYLRDLWVLEFTPGFDPVALHRLTHTPDFDEVFVDESADSTRIIYSSNGSDGILTIAFSDGTDPTVMFRPVVDKKTGRLERQSRPAFKR